MMHALCRTKVLLAMLCVAVVISFSSAQPVKAELITFVAKGTVDHVDPDLAGTFSIGDTFTVVYTFESETPDSSPTNPKRGDYDEPIIDLTVTVGTYSATANGGSYIYVFDGLSGDQYGLGVTNPMLGPSVNGYDLSTQTALMQLRDPTSTAFTGDALPTVPPDPNDYISGGTFLNLEFVDPSSEDPIGFPALASVGANVESITLLETITCPLDILPGDGRNPFVPNKKSKGRIPMAILGSEEVAAEDIDPASIKIAGTVSPIKTSADKDVDGDGLIDLVMHVSRRDLIDALALDTYEVGDEVEITVEAALLSDGTPIEATDSIVIVGN